MLTKFPASIKVYLNRDSNLLGVIEDDVFRRLSFRPLIMYALHRRYDQDKLSKLFIYEL